ncbi:hypothetical protein GH714_003119 [Hevea brasiliensis]|uniref:Uncharacterized protein n=1 Tax=Hevea brasiliensis TaxID=3981 RepID=A0A6A6LIB9_HEVBR|nr:hypothetical protein GH714_003119 [Hevea brasiliensis]
MLFIQMIDEGGLPNLPPGHMNSLPAFPSTPDASIGSAPGSYLSNRIMIKVVGGKKGTKPIGIAQDVWDSWLAHWSTPEWIAKSRIATQNQRSETGGPGTDLSKYTGDSRTAVVTDHVADERIRVLEEEIMRIRENQERIFQQRIEEEVLPQAMSEDLSLYARGDEEYDEANGVHPALQVILLIP